MLHACDKKAHAAEGAESHAVTTYGVHSRHGLLGLSPKSATPVGATSKRTRRRNGDGRTEHGYLGVRQR